MKISPLFLIISTLLIGINSSAQLNIIVNESDSIKSLVYKVYQLKTKNNKVIKSEPSILYDTYPIQYPLVKLHFNKHGLLIKKDQSHQKDTTYYNSQNQKIKMVLYPNPERSKDSISIYYTYDIQGHLKTEKMKASDPKLDYHLDGYYYSHKSLIDKFYINYYLSEKDPTVQEQFENVKPALNYYYRLFKNKNTLVKEKYVTTTKNQLPFQPDSTLYTITYQYNKENKVSKMSTKKEDINAIGKNYTKISTEQHTYLNQGLIHEINYFNKDKLSRQKRIVHSQEGVLTAHIDHWVNPNRTTTFVYDSRGELKSYTFVKKNKIVRNITLEYTNNKRGHWVECIHYDKKNKPKYLIERIIEYD